MREIFRKHGNWMLALLGVVLMFTWVAMPTTKTPGDSAPTVVRGKLGGRTITNRDLYRASSDLVILEHLPQALFNQGATGSSLSLIRNTLGSLDPHNRDIHLFLLLEEAKRYGMLATRDEVRSWLSQTTLTPAQQQAAIDQTQAAVGRPPQPMILDAIADCLAINKMNSMATAGLIPSLPELKHLAGKIDSKVKVQYIALGTKEIPDTIPQPSAEAIEKQWNTYKGVEPPVEEQTPAVVDGHRYPFGYKYPDRVKVEYLTFDRKGVRASLGKPTLDDIEAAMKYYDENRSEFRVTTTQPDSQPAGAASQPASTQPKYKAFKEVQQELVEQQMDLRVDKLIKQMTDYASAKAGEPWKKITEQGYKAKELPTVANVDYAKIAEDVFRNFKYLPTYHRVDRWTAAEELRKLPDIGDAVVINQNQVETTFVAMAMNVRELKDTTPKGTYLKPQVGVEGPLARDNPMKQFFDPRFMPIPAQQQVFMYRVFAVQRAHEPPTAAQVAELQKQAEANKDDKDKATAAEEAALEFKETHGRAAQDLRRVALYERYLKEGVQLANDAGDKGLPAVAQRNARLAVSLEPFQPESIDANGQLEPTPLPGLGTVAEFNKAALELGQRSMAAYSEPATLTPARTPATAASQPGEKKPAFWTTSVPVDYRLAVYVMQVDKFEPLPQYAFQSPYERMRLAQTAMVQAGRAYFAPRWGTLEAVAQRLDFQPAADRPFSRE